MVNPLEFTISIEGHFVSNPLKDAAIKNTFLSMKRPKQQSMGPTIEEKNVSSVIQAIHVAKETTTSGIELNFFPIRKGMSSPILCPRVPSSTPKLSSPESP